MTHVERTDAARSVTRPGERRTGGLADRLTAATRDVAGPLVTVDLDAFDANAADLLARAGGRPVRVATKSVRVPDLIRRALDAGFRGLMTYSLREAVWWADQGVDVLMGYPSVDRAALRTLEGRTDVTVMVDDVAQLALVPDGVPVCVDVDASLRVGPVHLGVRRSPLRTPEAVARVARAAQRRHVVRGLMFYEAQVAGLPDTSPAVRAVKRLSLRELATRRRAVRDAVEQALGRRLELVNGGGTGSLHVTSLDPVVTELTAGSGLLQPTLFDGYRRRGRPAAFVGLDVVRRPATGVVTVAGGGWVASGPAGWDRQPRPLGALRLLRTEGAGEVQTPLRGPDAAGLAVGDRVWLRHAKAGEPMEHVDAVVLVPGGGRAPTYRGLGVTGADTLAR